MKIIVSVPITSWKIDGETMEIVTDFRFSGSKVTVYDDCSHEIKTRLLLGRKAMTNIDNVLKRKDIIFPTRLCIIKAVLFPVKNWCFQTVVLEKTLESLLERKEIKSLNFNGNQPSTFTERTVVEAPVLWPHECKELNHWKRHWCWERLKAKGERNDRGRGG